MNALRVDSASSSTKPWVIGGSVLLAACAAVYAFNRRGHHSKPKFDLTEEQVFNILRDFRKEFYPYLKEVSSVSGRIQDTYLMRMGQQPPNIREILHQHLVEENSGFERQVEAIELRVLAKNNVSDPDAFKDACKVYAKKSARIEHIMREIRSNFEKAVLGVVVPISIPFPPALTQDIISSHFLDVTKSMARNLGKATQSFREKHGNAAFTTPAYRAMIDGLSSSLNVEQYHRLYPEELLRDYHVNQLFQYGVAHYSRIDDKFRKATERVSLQNQMAIKAMHQPECDYDKLFKEIEEWNLEDQPDGKNGFYIEEVDNDGGEKDDDWVTNKDGESDGEHMDKIHHDDHLEVPADDQVSRKSGKSGKKSKKSSRKPSHHNDIVVPEPEMPVPEATPSHPEAHEETHPHHHEAPKHEDEGPKQDFPHNEVHINQEHPGPKHPLLISRDNSEVPVPAHHIPEPPKTVPETVVEEPKAE